MAMVIVFPRDAPWLNPPQRLLFRFSCTNQDWAINWRNT